jgi:hypothetical protein
VLLVAQQAAQRLGLLRLHRCEQLAPAWAFELAQQVGCVVGLHRLEDVRGTLQPDPVEQLRLHLLRQLLHDVGELLVVEGLCRGGALSGREVAEALRHVGRVHVAQVPKRVVGAGEQLAHLLPRDRPAVAAPGADQPPPGRHEVDDADVPAAEPRVGGDDADVVHHP